MPNNGLSQCGEPQKLVKGILAIPLTKKKGNEKNKQKHPQGPARTRRPKGEATARQGAPKPRRKNLQVASRKSVTLYKMETWTAPVHEAPHRKNRNTYACRIVFKIEVDISAPPRPEGEGPHLHPKKSTIYPQNATIRDMAPIPKMVTWPARSVRFCHIVKMNNNLHRHPKHMVASLIMLSKYASTGQIFKS